MTIHLSSKSITDIDANVIVNAANGIGIMGAGVAGAISRAAGPRLENEAKIYCKTYDPQPGMVYLTRPWDLSSCGRVYHAVTMKYPGTSYIGKEEIGLGIVERCMESIFYHFKLNQNQPYRINNSSSIAIPALATGVGGLNSYKVAEIMVKSAINHGYARSHDKVIFCDINKEFLYNCMTIYNKLRESNFGEKFT